MAPRRSSRKKGDGVATTVPATAAAQALGYSLQFTRLTAMLLTAAEGSWCCLEILDDIHEETVTGTKSLVQSKSALGDNPVSDRAASLWKTLFNWLALARADLVQPARTIFELYVSRPVHGEIVSKFSEASSDSQAAAAIAHARQVLWGDAPNFPLKGQLTEETAKFVNEVLETSDGELVPLVKNMRLKCGSGSPQADLETIIRSDPVSPSKVPLIAAYVCGWVKRQADKLLEKSLPAAISRDEFHREYTAYCRKVDRDTILTSVAPRPSPEEMKARLPAVFVRQLDIIELDFVEKIQAISDYMRASADRTHWAKSGDVDETTFNELNDVLKRTWGNRRSRVAIEHQSRTPVEKGKLLHLDCMEHKSLVQGMDPPDHFIPGCFHQLADDKHVGWHPDFLSLLVTTLTSENS